MAREAEKVNALVRRISEICARSGRKKEAVTVLAATKYAQSGQINAVIQAGITVIGENRIQDAQKKFSELRSVRKHFIGHLQTNKVKTAVALFDMIECVDSYRLAEMIHVEVERSLKTIPVLIQVKVAEDPKKYGIAADEVVHFLKKLLLLKHLEVRGLMTILPYFDDPEKSRPYFREMKQLFEYCRKIFSGIDILSMGMSHDYEVAVEEGATEIRIGSYLFT